MDAGSGSSKAYRCTVDGCHYKFRCVEQLIDHCVAQHQMILSESPLAATKTVALKARKTSIERTNDLGREALVRSHGK